MEEWIECQLLRPDQKAVRGHTTKSLQTLAMAAGSGDTMSVSVDNIRTELLFFLLYTTKIVLEERAAAMTVQRWNNSSQ